MRTKVISWWSGGIASALACHWSVQMFKDVEIVFIDTKNEDDDTYRFKSDCEKLYGREIISITSDKYESIEDVWIKYNSLNFATGAICSTKLKFEVREAYQDLEVLYAQVFGFDVNERQRHLNMRRSYPEINALSPLVDLGITKAGTVRHFIKLGIEIPRVYKFGYSNNNCFKTGCVQGGIGYWQKIAREYPDKFKAMAAREHAITERKGEPVTMLKDRSDGKVSRLFLMPHPKYPEIKDLSMVKGREPESLIECNGFCKTDEAA